MKNKRSRHEAKERRKKMIYGIITILVMVSSGIAIFADSIGTQEDMDYNGYDFKEQEGVWVSEIDDQETVFMSHPRDVDYMSVDQRIMDILRNDKGVYVAHKENEFTQIDQVKSYFMSHLYYGSGKVSLNAVTYENDENVTVVNCSDATEENPVILFARSTNTGFDYEENCVTMMAPSELGLLRLADRLLYSLYGVIDDNAATQ